MSCTSQSERRLQLFQRGNDRCSICMVGFAIQDVEQGKDVTIEHVPPRSFSKPFSVKSMGVCLTCADCNNNASRVEKAVVAAHRASQRRQQKAQLHMAGVPVHTGYISVDTIGNIEAQMSKLRVSQETFSKSLHSGENIKLTWAVPTERYSSVPWLKAAYLAVFSLLGQGGYLYAQGKAIEKVRRQIMEPSQEILRHFVLDAPPEWRQRDGILMNRSDKPCWAVKMGDRLVLLPISWNTSFYEWMESFVELGDEVRLGGGPLWYPTEFERVMSFTFSNGYNPKQVGTDLFGRTGQVTMEDRVVPVVIADYGMRHVTMLSTRGLINFPAVQPRE